MFSLLYLYKAAIDFRQSDNLFYIYTYCISYKNRLIAENSSIKRIEINSSVKIFTFEIKPTLVEHYIFVQ